MGGFSAFVISVLLAKHLPAELVSLGRKVEEGRLDPAQLVAVRQTWAQVIAAAEMWKARRASADGSTEVLAAEMPAGSDPWIDTAVAADLLGVSTSRVRQLLRSGALAGRRAGGVWWVHRADCESYLAA
ncbi:helix-turn-helix domain-containing protein [Dactylosporangium sp. CA-139066]|uniref:helix-turn-helix domain-containing protein n=1 Tax=Dactylosporangium sp. CA-139066 TaxID=3239930 RepID=UPI003D943F00